MSDKKAGPESFKLVDESTQPQQQLTITEKGKGDRSTLRTITLRWADFNDGPIYYTDSWIKFWEDGAWAQSSTIDNRSEHSDWDVWIDIHLKNTGGDITAHLGDRVWFQDIDHDDAVYTKTATGWNWAIADGWRFIEGGHWVCQLTPHRTRDN